MDSFWCMCTVMHVSRFVRWMRVRSERTVMVTISLGWRGAGAGKCDWPVLPSGGVEGEAPPAKGATVMPGPTPEQCFSLLHVLHHHALVVLGAGQGGLRQCATVGWRCRRTHKVHEWLMQQTPIASQSPWLDTCPPNGSAWACLRLACVSAVHWNWMPSSATWAGWLKMNSSKLIA